MTGSEDNVERAENQPDAQREDREDKEGADPGKELPPRRVPSHDETPHKEDENLGDEVNERHENRCDREELAGEVDLLDESPVAGDRAGRIAERFAKEVHRNDS